MVLRSVDLGVKIRQLQAHIVSYKRSIFNIYSSYTH